MYSGSTPRARTAWLYLPGGGVETYNFSGIYTDVLADPSDSGLLTQSRLTKRALP
jgi:hypothetical protein